MFRSILSVFLAMAFACSCWADPPRIVATPAAEVVVVPVGDPVKVDVGKFIWLHVSTDKAGKPVDRPISWDFSAGGVVEKPADGAEVQWGGWLQGTERPAWHKVPKGSVPIFGGGESIDAGKFKFFEVPSIGDIRIGGTKQGEAKAGWHKPTHATAVPVIGVAKGLVKVSAWMVVGDKVETAKSEKIAELVLSVDGAKEEKVEPKPEPKPPAVTSFRVILGYESGSTMTQAQTNILFGNVVEEYLNVACTGGKSGWRRRDKDADGNADPLMSQFWQAVQSASPAVPFCAIEVNGGKPIIVPFEKPSDDPAKKGVTYTPAEFVSLLKTHNGGK